MLLIDTMQVKGSQGIIKRTFTRPRDAIYLVLRGSASISIDGLSGELTAGSVAYVPAFTKYSMVIQQGPYQAWLIEGDKSESEFFIRNKAWAQENKQFFDKGLVKVWELGGGKSLDIALAAIEDRHPAEAGKWALNKEVDMKYLIVSGRAKITLKDVNQIIINKGHSVLIEKGVPYKVKAVKGPLEVAMPSSPAWSPEQYELI